MELYINGVKQANYYAPSPKLIDERVYILPDHLDQLIQLPATKWFDETKMYWVKRGECQMSVSPLQFVANEESTYPIGYYISNGRCYWPLQLSIESLGGTYLEQDCSIYIDITLL